LPTQAYMGTSDAKIVDTQAGLESGITAFVGALAGINLISGGGMLDFLACQSVEKLVIDAEAIAMAQHLRAGIQVQTDTLATGLFEGINFKGDFLKQKVTRELFAKEQHLPSLVIDRDSNRGWQASGSLDTFARARVRTQELLAMYEKPRYTPEQDRELRRIVENLARKAGLDALPQLE
jgi:trimethylamine--corrinoid protein Co-methyltransferase